MISGPATRTIPALPFKQADGLLMASDGGSERGYPLAVRLLG